MVISFGSSLSFAVLGRLLIPRASSVLNEVVFQTVKSLLFFTVGGVLKWCPLILLGNAGVESTDLVRFPGGFCCPSNQPANGNARVKRKFLAENHLVDLCCS
ncbi:hypothetical protein Y1Q_0021133 [Alligator mississippiensis]|uniref:Uncharacterized protein n=1 Tax=Alligator mississippiensis TaxID=8496 RepID=A0A151NCM9_ALLMI|nr:hypothetical protein Y1Q_0021133 [Alligator mississippiensis]